MTRGGRREAKPCLGCNAMLRPSRTLAGDYPGTKLLYGLGRCRACREDMNHNGLAQQIATDVEAAAASLESYLASRRSNRLKLGTL